VNFQAAKCPECGGDLQVPNDRDFVKCMYCGRDIKVREAILDAAAGKVENWLLLAKAAAEASNHEEAYKYFTQVLEVDPKNHKAWFGKAEAAGWNSNLNNDRFAELLTGIQHGIEVAPEDLQGTLSELGAAIVANVSASYFQLSLDHFEKYVALDDSWEEHVDRSQLVLAALVGANKLDPKDKSAIELAIEVSKRLLEGVSYDDPYDTTDSGSPRRKSYHLPESMEPDIRKLFDGFSQQLRAIDPTYQTPEIKKAGEIGCGGIALVVVIVLLGAAAALWLLRTVFAK